VQPKLQPGPAYRLKLGVRWQDSRSQDWEPVTIDPHRSGLYCGQVDVDGEPHNVLAYLAPNVRYQKNQVVRHYAQKAMIGNRPSSLPIARYCGLAPRLGAEHGAGESARLSHAFHGLCAGTLAPGEWESLTDDEQELVKSWHKPADTQPAKGPLLRYDDAEKEVPLAVYESWAPVNPATVMPTLVFIEGTADFLWLVNAKDGTKVVFLADIKRTRFTALDGPESLQLLCYCWMACAVFNADAYCPGLWIAEEGEWRWADRIYRVDSPEGLRHLEQVEAAARNRGEAVTGSHCQGCYQRLNCPEHMAPVTEGELAPALNGQLTDETALAALLAAQRMKQQAEQAIENIKAAVLHGKVRVEDPEAGKRWRATVRNGRKSFNQKLARAELGEETIDRFMTNGGEYTEFRWVNS